MYGPGSPLAHLLDQLPRIACGEVNVLVTGESGVGKELVVRRLHALSHRGAGPFIPINCGAIPEGLLESELFGHVKGAFTGADKAKMGRLMAANGGTLFLDEIGNIPRQFQAKLLTALERREVVPVGANTPIPIDVRVISATNLPRRDLADESIFRQDLLYRLNTVEIELPPLRDRAQDIAMLAGHFTRIYARKYGRIIRGIAPETLAALSGYPWPGNVRALRHAVERAVILAESDVLTVDDFNLAVDANGSGDAAGGTTLAEMERAAIADALKRHTGNISRAAKELGITRTSLYRRMEKYGL